MKKLVNLGICCLLGAFLTTMDVQAKKKKKKDAAAQEEGAEAGKKKKGKKKKAKGKAEEISLSGKIVKNDAPAAEAAPAEEEVDETSLSPRRLLRILPL